MKASVFRFLEQPATHCSPAVPLHLSLWLSFPGGHSRTHFRLCPFVASPHLLSDVDTRVSASSEAGEFRVPRRLRPVRFGAAGVPHVSIVSLLPAVWSGSPKNRPEKKIMTIVNMIMKTCN